MDGSLSVRLAAGADPGFFDPILSTFDRLPASSTDKQINLLKNSRFPDEVMKGVPARDFFLCSSLSLRSNDSARSYGSDKYSYGFPIVTSG